MPVATSPKIPSSFHIFTCTKASDFPPFAWDALRRQEVNANVILPILLKCLKQEQAGMPVWDHLWIVVYTPVSYDVKVILSCTDGLTGKYPVFLFTPNPYPAIHSDLDTYPALEAAAVQLRQALPSKLHRVYSVFGPEILCRTFVTLWSKHTRIPINPIPYYEAKISYLTSETFVDAIHQLVPGEMRPAEKRDLDGVAKLCFQFATVCNTLLVFSVSVFIKCNRHRSFSHRKEHSLKRESLLKMALFGYIVRDLSTTPSVLFPSSPLRAIVNG